MNCDPLTVGFLYTALHSKDFHFCKKWTLLLQKNTEISKKKNADIVNLVTGPNKEAISK